MKLFLDLKFLVIFLFSAEVVAQLAPAPRKMQCNSEILTSRCADFKSSAFGSLIVLPDGTSFFNPAKLDRRFEFQGNIGQPSEDQEQYEKQYHDIGIEEDIANHSLNRKLCANEDAICKSGLIINLTSKSNSILMNRIKWDGANFSDQIPDHTVVFGMVNPSKFQKFDWNAKVAELGKDQAKLVTPQEFVSSLNALPAKQKKIIGEYLNQIAAIQQRAPWYKNMMANSDRYSQDKTLIEKRRQRAVTIASKAKLSIIKRLLAGQVDTSVLNEANIESFDIRSFAGLNSDLASLALKIQSTKIEAQSGDQEICNPMNAAGGRNAFYLPLKHSVVVCDQMLKAPDAHLVAIFAHEIAHSIDPCNISAGLYEYNWKAIATYQNEGTPNRSSFDKLAISEFKTHQGDLVLGSPEKYFSESFAKELMQKGFVQKIEHVDGLPSDRNPIAEIRECLATKGDFRAISKDEFDSYIIPKVQRALESRKDLSTLTRQEYITRAKTEFERDPICNSILVSELSEASSDVWGSVALGDYLKENPPEKPKKNSQDPKELARYFAALGPFLTCPKDESNAARADEVGWYQFSSYLQTNLKENFDKERNPHPHSEERTNKLILGNPDVAKAFGCLPNNETENCFASANRIRSSSAKVQKSNAPVDSKDTQK